MLFCLKFEIFEIENIMNIQQFVYQLKKILKTKWFWGIVFLVIFRLLVMFLAVYNIPDIGTVKGSWWFGGGVDGLDYFHNAKLLTRGLFGNFPLGFPLMMAPLVGIFHPQDLEHFATVMVFLHSVIFYFLITLIVFFLAKRFLKQNWKAVAIAAFFNIYPYFFYYFIRFFGAHSAILQIDNNVIFTWFMFLGVFSEPLSTLLMLGSLLMILKLAEKKQEKMAYFFFLGFIVSWAVITRIQNIVLLPFYGFVLAVLRRFKAAAYFTLGAVPFLIFQAYANWVVNHSVFKIGYELHYGPDQSIAFIGVHYIFRIIRYPLENCPLFFIPMILGLFTMVLGMIILIKKNRQEGILLSGYLLVNTIFILFLEPTLRNPRYFLPVIPVVFILAYVGLEYIVLKARCCFIKAIR